jgi:hypothetical protein
MCFHGVVLNEAMDTSSLDGTQLRTGKTLPLPFMSLWIRGWVGQVSV